MSFLIVIFVVGASFTPGHNRQENLETPINRVVVQRPIHIYPGSKITIWKMLGDKLGPNDIVRGDLREAPIDQSSSFDGIQHGHVNVYKGATRLGSAIMKGNSYYVDQECNNEPSTKYVCTIQGQDEGGLFVLHGTLMHVVEERQFGAGIINVFFLDNRNFPFEGELTKIH